MDFIYRSENKDISEEQRATIREHNKYTPEFPPYLQDTWMKTKKGHFRSIIKYAVLFVRKKHL
jgi:hypothetical protein